MNILLKTRLIFFAVVLLGYGMFSQHAQAAPAHGSIDFDGVVTFDTMSLATATRVTNWNSSFVLQDSGSFSGIAPGISVTMAAPWIFNSGTPSIPQPGPATPQLWQVGGFSFDLINSVVVSQSANFLNVTGTGTISGNGFDATPGTWSFTSSDSNGADQNTLGFQAQTTAVPEAEITILVVIGIGLLSSRRFTRRWVNSYPDILWKGGLSFRKEKSFDFSLFADYVSSQYWQDSDDLGGVNKMISGEN